MLIRIKGDTVVNHALDSKIERESAWSRKHSTVTNMQEIWNENIENNTINEPSQDKTWEEKTRDILKAKQAMKNSVKKETLENWNSKVKKLTFQGNFLELVIEERENITWQSIIKNVPNCNLSFIVKACVNGLNAPDNLKR